MLQNTKKMDSKAFSRMDGLQLLLVLGLTVAASADFNENCPQECRCSWSSGNKLANCSQSNLQSIPETLSPEIQNLVLSYNNLREIPKNAFENVQQINLKKLYLKECKLETIHKDGFNGLAIMIELDLSKNSLKSLHPDTFKETRKIRWITLNDNELEILDNGLFSDLPFLQTVELSNNRIHQIGERTFSNLPKLRSLELDGNRLEYLKIDTLSGISLSNLELQNNPWRCDATLHAFRNWVIRKSLYNFPITCEEPIDNQNKTWMDDWVVLLKPSLDY